eukprot:gnl/TRDRNA2_/TRDRNA2_35103_c0_seq1.p1 gnl/TRDRNA2_/TRDRNA2_35103_c0~~gnl/TRDRNA2_/TRDRNA2_35103_c0_seq1.p1  ORF type:complete len:265 (+),score=13.81 gnl/TRDRNA2_/TRDRNA2_35103_c0_seq1:61-855(+)
MTSESCPCVTKTCLVATACCPVASCCCIVATPCLCFAACILSCDEKKIKHVDMCHHVIDQYEFEVLLGSDDPEPPGFDDPEPPGFHDWRHYFDTISTACSSARSLGNYSQTRPADSSADGSWISENEIEDRQSPRSHDDRIASCSGKEPEMPASILVECCCEDGHASTWNDSQLWCPECGTWVWWPTWQHVFPCESAGLPWTPVLLPAEPPLPLDEAPSLCDLDGESYRRGIGCPSSPVKPGFRAGGGTAGPWWLPTDERFLGK